MIVSATSEFYFFGHASVNRYFTIRQLEQNNGVKNISYSTDITWDKTGCSMQMQPDLHYVHRCPADQETSLCFKEDQYSKSMISERMCRCSCRIILLLPDGCIKPHTVEQGHRRGVLQNCLCSVIIASRVKKVFYGPCQLFWKVLAGIK